MSCSGGYNGISEYTPKYNLYKQKQPVIIYAQPQFGFIQVCSFSDP